MPSTAQVTKITSLKKLFEKLIFVEYCPLMWNPSILHLDSVMILLFLGNFNLKTNTFPLVTRLIFHGTIGTKFSEICEAISRKCREINISMSPADVKGSVNRNVIICNQNLLFTVVPITELDSDNKITCSPKGVYYIGRTLIPCWRRFNSNFYENLIRYCCMQQDHEHDFSNVVLNASKVEGIAHIDMTTIKSFKKSNSLPLENNAELFTSKTCIQVTDDIYMWSDKPTAIALYSDHFVFYGSGFLYTPLEDTEDSRKNRLEAEIQLEAIKDSYEEDFLETMGTDQKEKRLVALGRQILENYNIDVDTLKMISTLLYKNE